ncbi:hypothetical protein GCM10010201_24810 [Pilimelia columellifera subsp. columellifera]|uniref:Uncharacterized protein n=1 Tax=Pilimelia columellifera subsp. columellifera TaxID=706583 RepID=A0ABN3NMU3_9ACTN
MTVTAPSPAVRASAVVASDRTVTDVFRMVASGAYRGGTPDSRQALKPRQAKPVVWLKYALPTTADAGIVRMDDSPDWMAAGDAPGPPPGVRTVTPAGGSADGEGGGAAGAAGVDQPGAAGPELRKTLTSRQRV